MTMILIVYFALKGVLLIALARTFVVYEPMQKHWIFLSFLYVFLLALLSWVFILSMRPEIPEQKWLIWLAQTFVLIAIYFKLLAKFDEGSLFWFIFIGGLLGLLWF